MADLPALPLAYVESFVRNLTILAHQVPKCDLHSDQNANCSACETHITETLHPVHDFSCAPVFLALIQVRETFPGALMIYHTSAMVRHDAETGRFRDNPQGHRMGWINRM